jgi:hypothetical protein
MPAIYVDYSAVIQAAILNNTYVVGTLQNFIYKHTIDLENVQRNKKQDKGGVTRHQVSSN